MNSIIIDGHNIEFKPFGPGCVYQLFDYLNTLSDQSKKRFGPHPFDVDEIIRLLDDAKNYRLYIAKTNFNNLIIAYAIVKKGWLEFDKVRLKNYGLQEELFDITIAPSVADQWQSRGLGSKFLQYIIAELKSNQMSRRIILWGGVQSDNKKAIGLYLKFGFRKIGEFENNGKNFDMIYDP